MSLIVIGHCSSLSTTCHSRLLDHKTAGSQAKRKTEPLRACLLQPSVAGNVTDEMLVLAITNIQTVVLVLR